MLFIQCLLDASFLWQKLCQVESKATRQSVWLELSYSATLKVNPKDEKHISQSYLNFQNLDLFAGTNVHLNKVLRSKVRGHGFESAGARELFFLLFFFFQ